MIHATRVFSFEPKSVCLYVISCCLRARELFLPKLKNIKLGKSAGDQSLTVAVFRNCLRRLVRVRSRRRTNNRKRQALTLLDPHRRISLQHNPHLPTMITRQGFKYSILNPTTPTPAPTVDPTLARSSGSIVYNFFILILLVI